MGGIRFFKTIDSTNRNFIVESMQKGWSIGFDTPEKPDVSVITELAIELYPVYVENVIRGWNLLKIYTTKTCEEYLELRKQVRPEIEIFNMNLLNSSNM